jgi:ABC-type nickel/cobalt efflux system permease component RcnA
VRVGAPLLVLFVDLKLLVVGIEEVDGEAGHVRKVVLAGLGDPAVGLLGGDVADNPADHHDRHRYQREHEHQHLPAQLQIVHEGEEVAVHEGPLS